MWRSQNLPPTFIKKSFAKYKFIIRFAQLVISHELCAIYLDCCLSFFSLLDDKWYSVFFILFMSLSKFIMFKRCFSLESYARSLNISMIYNGHMAYNGLLMICIVTPELKQSSL